MEDVDDHAWNGKNITTYFRQVKSRSRVAWRPTPTHAVVAPPPAIAIDPLEHDLSNPTPPSLDDRNASPIPDSARALTRSTSASPHNASPSGHARTDDRTGTRADPSTAARPVSTIRSSSSHDGARPRIASSSSTACGSGHEQSEVGHGPDGKTTLKKSTNVYHTRASTARNGANASNVSTANSYGMACSHNVSGSSPSNLHSKNIKPKSTAITKREFKPQTRGMSSCYHRIPTSSGSNTVATSGTRPRKRFRKKVSGLFGENTDLNKRMSKLIRDTDITKIKIGPDAADADLLLRHRQPAGALLDTGNLLSRLPVNPSSADSFDYKELTDAATKALGSPEKLAKVRKSMGTLDPKDNDQFLDALEFECDLAQGEPNLDETPNKNKLQEDSNPDIVDNINTGNKIDEISSLQPPNLSPVKLKFSTELEAETESDRVICSTTSTRANTRPSSSKTHASERKKMVMQAIPAVLRSKTRRADRGYRSKDVVEARLKTGTVVGSPRLRPAPGIIRSIRKESSTSSSRRFQTRSGGQSSSVPRHAESQDAVQGHRRKRGDDYSSGFCIKSKRQDQEHDDDEHRPKRRRRRGPAGRVDEDDLEGSPVTLATTMSDQDQDDDDEDDQEDPVNDTHDHSGRAECNDGSETVHRDYQSRLGGCSRISHDPLTMLVEAATGHQSVEEDEIQIERRRKRQRESS